MGGINVSATPIYSEKANYLKLYIVTDFSDIYFAASNKCKVDFQRHLITTFCFKQGKLSIKNITQKFMFETISTSLLIFNVNSKTSRNK